MKIKNDAMTDNHPITPPPELVEQWRKALTPRPNERESWIATLAARWGADQELEACCEWIQTYHNSLLAADLRGIRRPKPPSLKEQALSELNLTADSNGAELSRTQVELIRRALEAMPNE
jgi:hypothetical protein